MNGALDRDTGIIIVGGGGQGMRTEFERGLPDYVRNILDAARGGHDLFGNRITQDERRSIIDGYLAPIISR